MELSQEPIITKSILIKCDGGAGLLGHPLIYLNLGSKEKIVCPYCSQYFVKEDDKKIMNKAT